MISILIPIKNEPYIQELVGKINSVVRQSHEIIIIDKSDKKPNVNGAKVLRQKTDGLGNAILEGIAASRGDVIAMMDGDGSHDPKDLKKMIEKIPEYDIAIGSKLVKGGRTEDPISRQIVTRIFSVLARVMLGMKVKDPMTGFMVTKREVLGRIKLRPKGFKIVLEVLYKSRARVAEVPITFHARKAGESKVGFNAKGLKEVLRIINLMRDLRSGK
jgi:dolichol-phosphate mannosyltransferase